MEAIFGCVNLRDDPDPGQRLIEAAQPLIHSPISSFSDQEVTLAMSRIVIHSATQSPQFSRLDGSHTHVALTGEITNFSELKKLLSPQDTAALRDAELVGLLYEKEGLAFLPRLTGTFHFALWDGHTHKLVLACDKSAGIKPLYYTQRGDTLFFGSAAKLLLAHPNVPQAIDTDVLREILTLGFLGGSTTMFKDIRILQDSSCLVWQEGRTRIERYAHRNIQPDDSQDFEVLKGQYLSLLTSDVATASDADVPISVLLSGGVDSAALVSMMHAQGHRNLKTFSVHHGTPKANERDEARLIARKYKTEHHEILDLDASCMHPLPEMTWFMESPHVFAYPWYWLGRKAKQESDVTVLGLGNDCVWGWRGRRLPPDTPPAMSPQEYVVRTFLMRRRSMEDEEVTRLLLAPTPAEDLLQKLIAGAQDTGDFFNDMIIVESNLRGNVGSDREVGKLIQDAHGLPVRCPFMDDRIISLIDSLPMQFKWRRENDRPYTKYLFKRVMEDHNIVPSEIIHRKKMWIHSPMADWLRADLAPLAKRVLFDPRTRDRGHFNQDAVKTLWEDHQSGVDRSAPLMTLVTFEILQRLFIDSPTLKKPEELLPEFLALG